MWREGSTTDQADPPRRGTTHPDIKKKGKGRYLVPYKISELGPPNFCDPPSSTMPGFRSRASADSYLNYLTEGLGPEGVYERLTVRREALQLERMALMSYEEYFRSTEGRLTRVLETFTD